MLMYPKSFDNKYTKTPNFIQLNIEKVVRRLLLHNWHTYTYIYEEAHLKNYPIVL